MSDPRVSHEFFPNRKGLCRQIIGHEMCHLPEDAKPHVRFHSSGAEGGSMKWITFGNGYREEHQLIDESGRILGTVTRSDFERSDGWWATGEMHVPLTPLGRYATKKQAKSAVEAYTSVSKEERDR